MRTLRAVLFTLSLLAMLVSVVRAASRERVFTGFAGDQVFAAAVKAAHENYMVTRVDPKSMTLVFHTEETLTNNFDWTASVMKTQGGVKLVVNVPGRPEVLASTMGERIAEQLFQATEENLAKEDVIECGAPRPAHQSGSAICRKG